MSRCLVFDAVGGWANRGAMVLIACGMLVLWSCSTSDAPERNNPVRFGRTLLPSAPTTVWSVTGDNTVFLNWNGPNDSTIVSYRIWSAPNDIDYAVIDSVPAETYLGPTLTEYTYSDISVTNGGTYYYAVTSVNLHGVESPLSEPLVFDTPRPEGTVILMDYQLDPGSSGFDFSNGVVVPETDTYMDVYVDSVDALFYLNVADDLTDIQDMGYHESFDDLDVAPESGWSDQPWLLLISGHIYAIWTRDDHYAKMRVEEINPGGWVRFRWAYQPSSSEMGKREL